MLKFSFYHPYGYMGLEKATQKIPMLDAQCWDDNCNQFGFTVTLIMN